MNLTGKSEHQLVDELVGYLAKEREIETTVLHYLLEVERRQIFLARGFTSLFAFCIGRLGMSENEAQLRISAMRLMKEVPEVGSKIESGELSLSVAAKAQTTFRRERKKRKIGTDEKREVMSSLFGVSLRDAEKKLAQIYPDQTQPEKVKCVANNVNRIELNASDAAIAKYNRLMDILAHTNFERSYEVLFEKLADMALEKIDPVKKFEQSKPQDDHPSRKAESETKTNDAPILGAHKVIQRGRHIPAVNRREVFANFDQGCDFSDPVTGKRCGSTHGLQTDHFVEFSTGGGHEVKNLRLLCGPHNRFRTKSAREWGKSKRPYNPESSKKL